MNMRIGQQLGSYQLTNQLGQGGFAEVYLAEHIHLKTPVAVKLLYGTLTAQDVQAFTNEAQTIAALRHPHILRVLDFGFAQNLPFLVMDYAPGGTLRDRHPEGSIVPFPTLLAYITQVASALTHAHSNKLIHRDVKSENMLLDVHDNLLLSDFGIAAVAHSKASMKTIDRTGTVQYMAPEQIQGRPRPASDQYALAVVVYEWLCGELPFTGSTPIEIAMHQISDQPPSLCRKVPSLSPMVEQVIFKALAKDPEQRYPSVIAFAQAFEQAAGGRQGVDLTLFDQSASPRSPVAAHETGPYASISQSFMPSAQAATVFPQAKPQQTTNSFHIPSIPPTQTLYAFHMPSISPTQTPYAFLPPGPAQKSRKGYVATILVLVLIIAVMGTGGLIFLNAQRTGANTLSSASTSSQSSFSSHPSSVTGTASSNTLPTVTPPLILQTIQSNRQLNCASDYSACVTSITVSRFILDKSNGQTMMHFVFKNVGQQAHSFFVNIEFKDQAGNVYAASGQAADKSTWPIAANSSLDDLTSLFSFLPQSGETYTLTMSVDPLDTTDIGFNTYINQFSF